jgi:hypothetical protein
LKKILKKNQKKLATRDITAYTILIFEPYGVAVWFAAMGYL